MRTGWLAWLLLILTGTTLAQYGPPAQQQTSIVPCSAQQECVYWERCQDGYVTDGHGVLNLRTPLPVPQHLLSQYCEPTKICCIDPVPLVVQPPAVVKCPFYNDCVLPGICKNGIIDTSGAGFLDLRIIPNVCVKPSVCCQHAGPIPLERCPGGYTCSYPDACNGDIYSDPAGGYSQCFLGSDAPSHGVCCRPIAKCSGTSVCVTQQQCSVAGKAIIQGSCQLSGGGQGVCCEPPDPVLTCPSSRDRCVAHGTCPGIQGTDVFDPYDQPMRCYGSQGVAADLGVCCTLPEPLLHCGAVATGARCVPAGGACSGTYILQNGFYSECFLANNEIGVCCEPPQPQPCASGANCVGEDQCGTGIIDLWDDGSYQTCSANGHICCRPPTPVNECNVNTGEVCVNIGGCTGGVLGINNYGGTQECYYQDLNAAIQTGHCCIRKELRPCPGGNFQQCVPKNTCQGSGGTVTNEIGSQLIHECTINTYADGECCTPGRLAHCPENTECVVENACKKPSGIVGDCIYEAGRVAGVCCPITPKPVAIVDRCPDDGVCLPDIFCLGNAFSDTSKAYSPFTPDGGSWLACRISGTGFLSDGVCCKNAQTTPPLPPAQVCGISHPPSDTGTVGNQQYDYDPSYQAAFGEFPWQAIIFYTNFTFLCGAVLISDQHVVTAAHCVYDKAYFKSTGEIRSLDHDLVRIRLGDWKVDTFDELYSYLDAYVDQIILHDAFVTGKRPGNARNDIALLKLKNKVPLAFHIHTPCLPLVGKYYGPGTRCVATGWGKDEYAGGSYQTVLKKVFLPLVSHEQCVQWLRKIPELKFFRLHETLLCAGGELGKDTCTGDGGGPLVCLDPNTGQYDLVGLTAAGVGCGKFEHPGLYVNVQYFVPWLENYFIVDQQSQQQQQAVSSSYGKK